MKKIALVACSNGLKKEEAAYIRWLKDILARMGVETVVSPFLYAKEGAAGSARERAEILNGFYRDDSIDAVFDVSGGDLANEVLPWIDFQAIADSNKIFYGYSDLTTILNAIYAQTGKSSVLFQLKNLVWEACDVQKKRFQKYLEGDEELFQAEWTILQGGGCVDVLLQESVVVGGYIRCFLKLAGTKYFPDLTGKVLFLEALGGGLPQISTYMAQLSQIGAFEQVKAVLLGTFIKLEEEHGTQKVYEILKEYLPEKLLVARTGEIGHANDARALRIG